MMNTLPELLLGQSDSCVLHTCTIDRQTTVKRSLWSGFRGQVANFSGVMPLWLTDRGPAISQEIATNRLYENSLILRRLPNSSVVRQHNCDGNAK